MICPLCGVKHDGPCYQDERERGRSSPLLVPDFPENDCTDWAHPAWWRGHDQANRMMIQKINELIGIKRPMNKNTQLEWTLLKLRLSILVARETFANELEKIVNNP